jgi:hypothetical protein
MLFRNVGANLQVLTVSQHIRSPYTWDVSCMHACMHACKCVWINNNFIADTILSAQFLCGVFFSARQSHAGSKLIYTFVCNSIFSVLKLFRDFLSITTHSVHEARIEKIFAQERRTTQKRCNLTHESFRAVCNQFVSAKINLQVCVQFCCMDRSALNSMKWKGTHLGSSPN